MAALVPGATFLTRYIQEGDYVPYTPTSDVAAGAVVVNAALVGVAIRPIPANTLGAICVRGVFEMPKLVGTGTAIPYGTALNWDIVDQIATATAGYPIVNTPLGKAVSTAADGDATVLVRLFQ